MGYKKKKNIIAVTICMIVCFILYQLYFFLAITSVTGTGNKIIPVLSHSKVKDVKGHVRSEADKLINDNGVIRGVLYTMMPKYRPDKNNQFKCLYSEQTIPFHNVNDNYCDCEDSTDEPSTNACSNGTFYCDTQYPGKQLSYNKISSGKVNDNICDCCDGSDEWLQGSNQKLLSYSSPKHYRHYVDKCVSNCFK